MRAYPIGVFEKSISVVKALNELFAAIAKEAKRRLNEVQCAEFHHHGMGFRDSGTTG